MSARYFLDSVQKLFCFSLTQGSKNTKLTPRAVLAETRAGELSSAGTEYPATRSNVEQGQGQASTSADVHSSTGTPNTGQR